MFVGPSGEPEDFAAKIHQSFKGLSGTLMSRTSYAWDHQKGYIGCGLGCDFQAPYDYQNGKARHMLYLVNLKDGVAHNLKLQTPSALWKTVESHPLVFFINKFIPNHLYLYHSNERNLGGEDGKTSLIEFRYTDEVLAITAPQRYKQWYRPRVNILHNTGEFFWYTGLEL